MNVFAAFYGQYEEPHPIGIYQSLEQAKKAVEKSNPTYNTEVLEYDTTTGNVVKEYWYSVKYKGWADPVIPV